MTHFGNHNTVKEDDVEVVIPAGKANLFSFILFPIVTFVFGLPYALLYSLNALRDAFAAFLTDYVMLALMIVAGTIAHELLHALVWGLYSGRWSSVSFGFHLKQLSPYVTCAEPLPRQGYVLGVATPGMLLGVMPCCLSILSGLGSLLCFGIFFTAGAASDFLSLYYLAKLDKSFRTVQDHPLHAGFIAKQ